MAILYVAVYKGLRTGAEYAACKEGDIGAVAKQQYLPTVARQTGKYCFLHQGHTFSFFTKEGTTFACVATESYGRLLPTSFLERLAQDWARWSAEAGGKHSLEQEGQWTQDCSKNLKSLVNEISAHPGNFSKVHDVQLKVEKVKEVALQNMQAFMERQGQLERIGDQTDALLAESKSFINHSKNVRSHFRWQSLKIKLLVAAAALLLIVLVFLVICFGAAHCFDR